MSALLEFVQTMAEWHRRLLAAEIDRAELLDPEDAARRAIARLQEQVAQLQDMVTVERQRRRQARGGAGGRGAAAFRRVRTDRSVGKAQAAPHRARVGRPRNHPVTSAALPSAPVEAHAPDSPFMARVAANVPSTPTAPPQASPAAAPPAAPQRAPQRRIGVTCTHCGWSGSRRTRAGLTWRCPKCGRSNDGPTALARLAEKHDEEQKRKRREQAQQRERRAQSSEGVRPPAGGRRAAAPPIVPPAPTAPPPDEPQARAGDTPRRGFLGRLLDGEL